MVKKHKEAIKRKPKSRVSFYINGEKHSINNPDPNTLLVDYLRSTPVGLTGTKHSCGQGGCGACSVMLSYFDERTKKVVNVSANSCLRPVAALDGMEITTVEGLGSVNTEVSEAQYAIAKNNGSQCGYCTPGFVMNLHSLLVEKEGQELTQKQIEQNFDGNICRCTGFRPILHAAKKFATDWTPSDDEGTPTCYVDPAEKVEVSDTLKKVDEDNISKNPAPLRFEKNGSWWYRPETLLDVHHIMNDSEDPSLLKLVSGNTSVGIPNINPVNPTVMVDLNLIGELKEVDFSGDHIVVGASTTYNEFLDALDAKIKQATDAELKGLDALHYMALRTAGKIVRNVATLSGNTMLVTRNVKSGYPFPSDLFMAMVALDTTVEISWLNGGVPKTEPLNILDFVHKYNAEPDYAKTAIIVKYNIPYTAENEYVKAYKVSLRKENSHSLTNGGFKIRLDENGVVQQANILFGAILTAPFRAEATEAYLVGKSFSASILSGALEVLNQDLDAAFASVPQWVLDMPTEGVTDDYKRDLANGYLYKFFVETLQVIAPDEVPEKDQSADYVAFNRPVSVGSQTYKTDKAEFPVSIPIIKLSAFEQATGEAMYTHDIPVPVKGLQGAFVTSNATYANFKYFIPQENGDHHHVNADGLLDYLKTEFPGVVDYLTYKDIPEGGANGTTKSGVSDPIFCEGQVTAYGQSIGLVVANDEQLAQHVADYVATECIHYVSSEDKVNIDLPTAIKEGNLFTGYTPETDDNELIQKVAKGQNLDWAIKTGPDGIIPTIEYGQTTISGEECVVVAGTQSTGDQIHFYMETQATLAEPGEHKEIIIKSSTQSPDSAQSSMASSMGILESNVNVKVKRLGGGYGGKTTRTPYVSSPTGIAAKKLKTAIRTAMPRKNDSFMVGNRHPFLGEYNIAIVPDGSNKGKLMGSVFEFYSDGGNTVDCSFDVMDCAILGSDNCYNVPNFSTEGHVAQTNKSSNGAMRSYGGVQCGLITEEAIESAAHKIGMLAEDVRELNFYQLGDYTPYGQQLDYCLISDVWKRLRKTSEFDTRRAAVEEFNAKNKWKKRGISMIPMKYGLGYNLGFLMQGGALIDVYASDGSVLVSHGGVEMGQGIMTKIAQIAAETLNIPLELIQMTGTRTSVIPNAVGTGATSGTDLNGGAVQKACKIQRKKLEAMCMALLQANGSDWCEQQGINYWDYADEGGWKAQVSTGSGGSSTTAMIWNNVVSLAYQNRVDLSSQALYGTPGLKNSQDQQFYGYTYSAACSEVEIDVLTGESNIIRTDILYDIGQSLNPAIDIGQIEGAFIMGVGNVTTEKLVWQDKTVPGAVKGKLNTPNTWTYKPPCAATIPLDFRVDLFPRDSATDVPENPNLLMSSKGIGEPPLVLANTVFFAIKKAVLAARKDRGLTDWFQMDSPATVQEIRTKCAVSVEDLNLD